MIRLLNGEGDRGFESYDHAYSQGRIEGARQAIQELKEMPPQVTVNPEGPSLHGVPAVLISLLVGAGLTFLWLDGQGAPEDEKGPLIEQHFDQGEPPPPQRPAPETSEEPAAPPARDEPDGGEAVTPEAETVSSPARKGADAPADREPAASSGSDDPAPEPPAAEPEPEPEPTPQPEETAEEEEPGVLRQTVDGVGDTVDGTVDGATDVVGGVVCGLLCPQN